MTKLFDKNSEDFLNAIKGVVESSAAFEKARDEEKKKRMSGEDRDKVAKLAAMMSKEKKLKESVDQIDELSLDTLSNYMDKASDAKGHRKLSTKKVDNRYKGVALAQKKGDAQAAKMPGKLKPVKTDYEHQMDAAHRHIYKEDADQIDELSVSTLDKYRSKARQDIIDADANDDTSSYNKRVKGYRAASKQVNKKLAKEEAEQIDELSSAKLGKYISATREKGKVEQKKRAKGVATAVDKMSYPKGSPLAKRVPATEEVEQIAELSKKTLGSYVNKASERIGTQGITAGLKIANDEKSGGNLKNMGKRQKGIAKAVDRLTKEEIEMIEAKLAGVEAGAVPGNEHLCATKIFHKEWNEGQPIHSMHAEPDANGLIEWYDVMFEHGIERVMTADVEILEACTHGNHKRRTNEEVEQIDELSKGKLATYINKAEDSADDLERKGIKGDDKSWRKMHKRLDSTLKAKHKWIHAKEEVEELDELSHDTLRSYRMKAKSIADHGGEQRTKGRELASRKSYGGRMAGVEKAKVMAKEEADLEESVAAAAKHLIKRYGENVRKSHVRSAASDLGVDASKLAKTVRKHLGKTTLDEARGRPKKAAAKDFTVHPITKEKLMHNNPEHMKKIEKLQKHGVLEKPKTEAGQHIINQLRKASTSMQGGATVHFTHGESKHVSAAHAGKALDKYASMKPSEKEDYQKKIGHSHENLMKHI